MATRRILSVGQCGPDDYQLTRFLRGHFAGAQIDRAAAAIDARALLAQQPYDLILVNRVLDGDGTSGVDFIARAVESGAPPHQKYMLISDFPDAQGMAVAVGAVRGFGKSQLHSAEAEEALRQGLGAGG